MSLRPRRVRASPPPRPENTHDRLSPSPHPRRTAPEPPPRSGWFRAFWRWHFYASFLVIPVLLVLAVTGLIYLFRFQLEPLLHADLMKVEQPADVDVQPAVRRPAGAVEKAHPDATVVSMAEPRSEDRSTVFSVTEKDGSAREVYVDPWTAEVLGDLDPDTTLSGIAIRLHADLMSGVVGDRVMELGTCWALVMALTGYYLFVRGWRARRRNRQRGRPGAALRSRHGLLGSVVGVGLLFMVVSGLPWTGRLGRAGAEARDHDRHLDVERRPRRPVPADLHARRVAAAQPRRAAVGAAEVRGAEGRRSRATRCRWPTSTPPSWSGEREGLRHPMTVALPGRRERHLLGDRLRLRPAQRRAHRAHRPVRREGARDLRVRRLPAAREGGLPGHRPARGPQPRPGEHGRLRGVLRRRDRDVRDRPADVVAPAAPRARGRALPGAGCRCARHRLWPSGWSALGVFLPLFGISLLVVLLLDALVLRRVPALGSSSRCEPSGTAVPS